MTCGNDVRPGRAEDGAELVAAIEKRLSEAAQVLAGGPDRWRLARGEQLLRDVEEVTAACTGMCTDVHLVAALVSVRNNTERPTKEIVQRAIFEPSENNHGDSDPGTPNRDKNRVARDQNRQPFQPVLLVAGLGCWLCDGALDLDRRQPDGRGQRI